MEAIKDVLNELDRLMVKTYDEYISLHERLNLHRGKLLEDTNLLEVNNILTELQNKFSELYPAYYFIATRYQQATQATNSYNEFIETIKKAGATEHGQEKPTSTLILT